MKASSSVPFIFAPTQFEGHTLIDGGVIWNININRAIERCLEIVEDEAHIIMDITITEYLDLPIIEQTGKTLNNFSRKRDINKFYAIMNDIVEQTRAHPDVNYRYFMTPSKSLGGAKAEAAFDQASLWEYQKVGR